MADAVENASVSEVQKETTTAAEQKAATDTAEDRLGAAQDEADAEQVRLAEESAKAAQQAQEAEEKASQEAEAAWKADLKRLIGEVSANPGAVAFQADLWGFTSDVKKVVLLAASKVKGQDEKQRLLLSTLGILTAHIRKRFEGDKEFYDERSAQLLAYEEDRNTRERQHGVAVSTLMGE